MNAAELFVNERGSYYDYQCKLNPAMLVWRSKMHPENTQWTFSANVFGEFRSYYDTKEEAMEAAVALLVALRLT